MTDVMWEHPLVRAVSVTGQTRVGERSFLRLEMSDWVNVVAITASEQLVLVRQYRWGIGASTLEIPGGAIDLGEDPSTAAVRELREETGYGGGTLLPMGAVWSNPAIQTNRTWLFALTGAEERGAQQLDGTEDCEVELHPLASLPGLLRDGAIDHSLAVVSLQRFLLWHDGLTAR